LKISLIIPVLNEAGLLRQQLEKLQPFRLQGHEIIVVDGGSHDGSETIATPLVDRVCSSTPGRASQMNHGAGLASGDVLLFLHIDTDLPTGFASHISQVLEKPQSIWGRFDVKLSSAQGWLPVIATAMNLRSRLTGVVTGDQAIFVRRQIFEQVKGYAPIPLMEDIEFSKRLRRLSWPVRIRQKAVASSRRWEQNGVLRTVLAMWWLRLLYFIGVSPGKLVTIYYK